MVMALSGIRALVTRPAAQGEALCTAVRGGGGEAACLPLLEIEPLPVQELAPHLEGIGACEIAVFVSANAVRATLARLREAGLAWPAHLRSIAIGSATRAALAESGI